MLVLPLWLAPAISNTILSKLDIPMSFLMTRDWRIKAVFLQSPELPQPILYSMKIPTLAHSRDSCALFCLLKGLMCSLRHALSDWMNILINQLLSNDAPHLYIMCMTFCNVCSIFTVHLIRARGILLQPRIKFLERQLTSGRSWSLNMPMFDSSMTLWSGVWVEAQQ